MFAKPLNLILVYIVTVFNIAILASPLIALLVPFIDRHNPRIDDSMLLKLKLAVFALLFLVSFFMLLYMLLDFLFSFSLRTSLKDCVRYEKIEDYEFLTAIFEETQEKFAEKSVKLYIKNSSEINAFAVSSMSKKAIVLTSGLIDHYLSDSENPQQFLLALRSIIGHEMSHLVNKDFLPTFLIIANEKATNFVSVLLDIIFRFTVKFSSLIPGIGVFMSTVMIKIYNLLDFLTRIFNRIVVANLYEFLRRFVSRSIEYRCDKQSAQAFGGKNMAFALSFLGESGYFTLFSTHPRTQSRMKKVANVEMTDNIIHPRFVDSLSNYISIMFLIITCLYFAKQAHVDLAIRFYLEHHEMLNRKLSGLWHLISRFF